MMTRKKRRLTLIASALAVFGFAVGLVLYSLRDTIVFFYGPTEYLAKAPPPGTRLRIGGLVEAGTFKQEGDERVRFAVTDVAHAVPVTYTGLLPDLFREGQGAGVEGIVATTILAKHDERYMPPEVADALKKQGVWKDGEALPTTGDAAPRAVASSDNRAGAGP